MATIRELGLLSAAVYKPPGSVNRGQYTIREKGSEPLNKERVIGYFSANNF